MWKNEKCIYLVTKFCRDCSLNKIAFICKLRGDYGKKIRQAILMAWLDGVKSPYFKKDELHADK